MELIILELYLSSITKYNAMPLMQNITLNHKQVNERFGRHDKHTWVGVNPYFPRESVLFYAPLAGNGIIGFMSQ